MGYIIRAMKPQDAKAFIELLQTTDAESDFMLQEPGERKMNSFQVRMAVSTGIHRIFLAEEEETGRLIGHIAGAFPYGQGERIKHAMHIGISILKEFWGQGLGNALFEALENWGQENGIHRLELTVMTHNERGVALYQKRGFEIEGTKKHSAKVNGQYIDEYLMAKLF
ncbi:GNAT family N-acetyltransferase [Saprospira sp. CCB-QB6]|uniref:GNAT family N-acetyltransferase n=1 Tax=Saprospira sp. CCB-QB6 TaxID=3023936 RepID=UPI00234B5F6D|nr:GNAT family N-acetyltransferase [Saprospira sp. CCB-QB6]WCL80734.1 GNAT family N-acetyltransferase [Saprospira sp. CCB-QB6]